MSTIGNLNGRWAVLFKLMTMTYPVALGSLLGWGTWVTAKIFTLQDAAAHAMTDRDAAAMQAKLTEQIVAMPPPDWKARVIALETTQRDSYATLIEVKTMVGEVRRQMDRLVAEKPK